MNSLDNNIRTRFFYFNDLHCNTKGAKKIKTVSDEYDKSIKGNNIDSFKICAGDTYIGRTKNNFAGCFLNTLNLDAMTLGNHEFDMGTKKLGEVLKNLTCKVFALNLGFKPGSNLTEAIQKGNLTKGAIFNKNGHKYGVLGVSAADIKDTISAESKKECSDVDFMDFAETLTNVQKEVDNLKKQGINKIVLISHLGFDRDKKLAQLTDGIDVIIGGHSHHNLEGIQPQQNYFLSKSGEPVLITQAGQNGENFGILETVFDDKGILKAADNITASTDNFKGNKEVAEIEKQFFGEPLVLGKLTTPVMRLRTNFGEHPLSCFVADAMRYKSGAQIAFHNRGCQKIDLKPDVLTDMDVKTALPYINSVAMYKLSEKDVVDAIQNSLIAPKDRQDKIGNLQVSGVTYKVKNNKLSELYLIENDGSKTKLNCQNPSNDKFFTVTYGSFLAGGPDRMGMLKADSKKIKDFEWNDLTATLEYMQKISNNGEIQIKGNGRIIFED